MFVVTAWPNEFNNDILSDGRRVQLPAEAFLVGISSDQKATKTNSTCIVIQWRKKTDNAPYKSDKMLQKKHRKCKLKKRFIQIVGSKTQIC